MPRITPAASAAVLAVSLLAASAGADTVNMESGLVYRGTVAKDNTVVTIFDGLKRIIVRDTKVASIVSEANERYESFYVEQPLITHGGTMPSYAISIKAGPWDEQGRRSFEYVGPRSSKPVRMTQVINELGPKFVRYRGVDGFWQGQIVTTQVPKEVVLGILSKVDQAKQSERLKVGRFLIQIEWYAEALAELERIGRDFPELAETVKNVRHPVLELRARRLMEEIETCRKAQQPQELRTRLRSFPTEGAPAEILTSLREQIRLDEDQRREDQRLAQSIRAASEALTTEQRETFRGVTQEMLVDLTEAPDAVRERFGPFVAARDDPAATAEGRWALAVSGYLAGAEAATAELTAAEALLRARDAVQAYLGGADSSVRAEAAATLAGLSLVDPATKVAGPPGPAVLTRLVRNAPPPLREARTEVPGQPRRYRAADEANDEPTEYVAVLPPEYHPARRYPAVVALHAGDGPEAAAQWWGAEAARRGYIVIAPEYALPDQPPGYRYTVSEHAAAEIALRDARRRFSIDSDRVFLAGVLFGGDMAWDFGLTHPDLFAGVAIVSGLPGKYVWSCRDNAKLVPLYVALGDLAPAEADVVLPLGATLITRNYNTTYVEYYKRGLEPLPEEIPAIFDWMGTWRRDPYPKEFEASTGRECDARFFGVVARQFSPRRSLPPEQVEPLGKNLKPATITRRERTLANLLDVTTSGIERLDVWLAPTHLDLSKRFEIRINGRTAFKGTAKPEIEPFLEDLRIRGDREQLYWLRYTANLGGARPR